MVNLGLAFNPNRWEGSNLPSISARLLACLACALLTVATSGCDSEPALDSSGSLVRKEGRIAFTRATSVDGTDIESDVYVTRVDGSEETRLTDTPGFDGMPTWSPDGGHIAFASDRDGNWELYVMNVMNADGTEPTRLTNSPRAEGVPAFSPDGDRIAYVVDPLTNPTIYVMNADGTGQRHLTGGNWPSWSADGERISYTAYASGEEIWVINANGTDQRRLTDGGKDSEGAWSPDGAKIAFVSWRDEDEEIYVMNADGTEQKRLTDIPGNDHWPPTWSPDNTRIAFTSDGTKDNSEIYIMNSDGSGLTKLTEDPADDAFPAWRP